VDTSHQRKCAAGLGCHIKLKNIYGFGSDSTGEPTLTSLRKLELSCGIATAIIGILLSLFVLKFDSDAALIVQKQFVVARELLMVVLVFIFPSALVAVGSYLHASKRRAWGQVMLGIGWVAVVGIFLLFFIIPLFGRINAWFVFNVSAVLLASLSLLFSVMAEKESN
jgi:MFS family permease